MIESYVMVLFSLGVLLTIVAMLFLNTNPATSFLTSMFAVVIFAATAYSSNMIQIYGTYLVNNTSAQITPTITRDPALQWLSVLGMILNAVLLWLSSSAYGGAK